jgi:hypothetical protein
VRGGAWSESEELVALEAGAVTALPADGLVGEAAR